MFYRDQRTLSWASSRRILWPATTKIALTASPRVTEHIRFTPHRGRNGLGSHRSLLRQGVTGPIGSLPADSIAWPRMHSDYAVAIPKEARRPRENELPRDALSLDAASHRGKHADVPQVAHVLTGRVNSCGARA
jgi:hypothetical protein